MECKGEAAARVVGGRMRMIPSRRAFRYLAWLSRSIPMLAVAVEWEADGGELQPLDRTDQAAWRQLPTSLGLLPQYRYSNCWEPVSERSSEIEVPDIQHRL